ncbi:MAG: hypothetical protein JXM69_09210 [Anaerolineae bacterium]|nr:hypothetical protein [Anaerolineae bacterium]
MSSDLARSWSSQARGHVTAHPRGGKIIAQGGSQGVKHLLYCRTVDNV